MLVIEVEGIEHILISEEKYSKVLINLLPTKQISLLNQLVAKGHSSPQEDNLKVIEQLASLKDKGVITEEEFTAKKKQLLGL